MVPVDTLVTLRDLRHDVSRVRAAKMRNRNLVTINHHFRAHTHTKKKSSMQTPHFVGKILTRDSINSPQPAGVLKTERVSWAIWTRINQRTWRHYRVKISYRGGTPPSLISRIQMGRRTFQSAASFLPRQQTRATIGSGTFEALLYLDVYRCIYRHGR